MYRIRTYNNISEKGLAKFNSDNYEVGPDVENPDAIILRSYKLSADEIPASVKVIGRAGAGTNNIPVEAMNKLGIPVMNTPGANANAVKELVISGMLLAARNICPAWDYARQVEGDDQSITKAVEANKKNFAGFELPGKTLAVIGLGKIGVRVANAARILGMNVIGYDPAMTIENAWELRSSVQQADTIEQAIANADFISIHVPLIEPTKNLINAERLALLKDGAVLLNFSRDGIVNNKAVADALSAGKLRNYVCDFPNNLFKSLPNVICLPHLGASTREAEENCAIMIAEQTKEFLEKGHIQYSVNFPSIKMTVSDAKRLAIVNSNVPNMVAQISTALSDEGINIIDMINKSRNDIAYTLLDINTPVNEQLLTRLKSVEGIIRARPV